MIRVIWRFRRGAFEFKDLRGDPAPAVRQLGIEQFGDPSPVFPDDDQAPEQDGEFLDVMKADPVNDFPYYFQAFVDDAEKARPLLASLEAARSKGLVEWFDLQANIGSQIVNPGLLMGALISCGPDPGGSPTQAWDSCQVYLDPPNPGVSPSGVNARFAWGLRGGQGRNATIIDIEKGWLLDHEDLAGQIDNVFGTFPNNPQDIAHGTAVLGILCANPQTPANRMGVIGIAHRATVQVASFLPKSGQQPNPEGVVKRVCKSLSPGDVILLEVQATRPGSSTPLPLEAWPHGQAAINYAHGKKIHVVEPAGNGGVPFSFAQHGVPNTGPAIMVGAGNILNGHVLSVSNRGPRVDLQGWGTEVVTTGFAVGNYSDLQARQRSQRCYTRSFNGTSSAAAIVAGCVAVISSVVRAHGFGALEPGDMKNLLRRTGTFRDSADVINGLIGPLPNLRAALEDLEAELKQNNPDFSGFDPA